MPTNNSEEWFERLSYPAPKSFVKVIYYLYRKNSHWITELDSAYEFERSLIDIRSCRIELGYRDEFEFKRIRVSTKRTDSE